LLLGYGCIPNIGKNGIHAGERVFMQGAYLTTEEAAAYLRIKERKLYELIAQGAAPASKVTGKWLMPRAGLDHWVQSGIAPGAAQASAGAPPIIGGSHDPLLEWAARRSGSALALLSEGSEAGLDRLCADAVGLAAIHMHDRDSAEGANERAVATHPELRDVVVIAFARREQGLMVAPGNPRGIASLRDAAAAGVAFGLRQKGAGAQLLLERLLAEAGLAMRDLDAREAAYPTGQDLGQGIRAGEIDCGLATRAVAAALGLGFVPLGWERFDLALRRRTYFEPGPQALVALMRAPEFARQAAAFSGYDVSEAGQVRLNR
jgi:putative molybdopterin biosynthesis protein